MTEKKKSPAKKKASSTKKSEPIKKASSTKKPEPVKKTRWYKLRQKWHNLRRRRQNYLKRRPHRSFRMTRRRDYVRKMAIPGYWSLTIAVFRVITSHKMTFFSLGIVGVILTMFLSGLMTQDTYQQMKDVMASAEEIGISSLYSTAGLFFGVVMNYMGSSVEMDSTQQLIGGYIALMVWLTSIWLTRAYLAGKKPKMRDALYSSGSPIIALVVLVCILLIQLLPAAIAVIIYGALDASGMLNQTFVLMLFGGAAFLVLVVSLYWITSTLLAMVIVTLPGMYPLQAIRLAGDLVVGRRLRILIRLFWMIVVSFLLWLIILLPVILLDSAIKQAVPAIDWMPIVPITGLTLTIATIIFSSIYVYMLYRRIVESDVEKSNK